jgi:hypothetical protein
MPALPLHEAGPYVAAAYLVFLALILIYVGIMAGKLVRIERQAAELNELAARRLGAAKGAPGGDHDGDGDGDGDHDVVREPAELPVEGA